MTKDNSLELLDRYFETAFAAPDGIKRLRELILSLAMRGKLVPQDPNEQPANVLLKEIEAEKNRLVKEGKIKKSKPLPKITPDEIPCDLPDSWEWVKLDDIASYIQRGKSPKYVDKSDFPVIAQKCIQWNGLELYKAKFICPESIQKYSEERFLKTGDLLWNSTGLGTLGRVGIYIHEENDYEKVVADSHVTVIRPLFIESIFLYLWLSSGFVQNNIENKSSGSTKQIELATSTIKNHIFPLPPLEEQRRIVERIDRLMDQVDVLEKLRAERDKKRLIIQRAAGDRLLKSETEQELGEAWDFLKTHFNELYSVKENVSELRKAILQLAVMGKLVPQDPRDRPASELLKEKKSLSKIKEEEKLFTIPKSWIWIRSGETADFIDPQPSHRTPPEYKDGVPYIGYSDINHTKGIDFQNARKINPTVFEEHQQRYRLKKGDFVFGKIGTLGEPFFLPEPFSYCLSANLILVQPNLSIIHPKYLAIFLDSPSFLIFLHGPKTNSTHGVFGIKKARLICCPLPPLPEQHRIVAKVDQLMALCDQLETKIEQTTDKCTSLLDAVMAKI